VAVDGVLGDPQATGDLLGVKVLGDQPQAFALTRRELLDRVLVVCIPHRR
jgi:hypothetical protein